MIRVLTLLVTLSLIILHRYQCFDRTLTLLNFNQLKILAILEDSIVVIYEKCNHRYANIFLGTGVPGKDDQMHSTVKTKRVRL
jgi:hypothetical protein